MPDLKEIYDDLRSRMKSHVFSSIAIAFVLWNWKVLYVLCFSDMPILERFTYFDDNTSIRSLYCWPVGLGLVVGLLAPFVNAGASWLVGFALNFAKTNDLKLKVRRAYSEQKFQKKEKVDLAEFDRKKAEKDAETAELVARQKKAESQYVNLLAEKGALGAELEKVSKSKQQQLENLQFSQRSEDMTFMHVISDPKEATSMLGERTRRVAGFLAKRERYQASLSEIFAWYEQVDLRAPVVSGSQILEESAPPSRPDIESTLNDNSSLKIFRKISTESDDEDAIFQLTPLGLFLIKHKYSQD